MYTQIHLMWLETIKSDVLADENTDSCRAERRSANSSCQSSKARRTDARHVEAVEEGLDGAVDVRRLALALELEDALSNRRHDGVMSSFDVREDLREPFVVVVYLWWPFDA